MSLDVLHEELNIDYEDFKDSHELHLILKSPLQIEQKV